MKKCSVQYGYKAIILFFLFFIQISGNAQLCIDFTTTNELNNCLENEVDRRISAYCAEHNIDFNGTLLAFNTYLVNAGFCTTDSIGAGYNNFYKHISAPIDKTTLISSLDSTLLQHILSMFEELYQISIDQIDYIYLDDYMNDVKEKCREDGFLDALGLSEHCRRKQLIDSTSFSKFYLNVFFLSKVTTIGSFIEEVATYKEEFEAYEKSTYLSLFLFLLSKYPYINRIINGEAIFCYYLLDNYVDVSSPNEIFINAELISETAPNYIHYIYTPSGELEDVKFFQSGGKILKEEKVSEEIKNIFKNSTFTVGIYENKNVKYFGTKFIRYE